MTKGTIENCLVTNASFCCYRIFRSDDNDITSCTAYVDDDSSKGASDYGFDIADSDLNDVAFCCVERHLSAANNHTQHAVHAFVVQAREDQSQSSTQNTFAFCEALNTWELFYLRGQGVSNNKFLDSIGTGSTMWRANVHIHIATGPNANFFSRIRLISPKFAIKFSFAYASDLDADFASVGNRIDNCIFEDIREAAIECSYTSDDPFGKKVDSTEIVIAHLSDVKQEAHQTRPLFLKIDLDPTTNSSIA